MSPPAGDRAAPGVFTTRLLGVFDVVFEQTGLFEFSSLFVSQGFVLMEACAQELLLRRLRVMVILKVCVCCSSILSSSDTLMKGHQANAWRKPARNLRAKIKGVFMPHILRLEVSGVIISLYLWFRQQ